jgi:hypothetical protein
MLAASLVGIFFVPAIFYLVERISGAGKEETVRMMITGTARAEGD